MPVILILLILVPGWLIGINLSWYLQLIIIGLTTAFLARSTSGWGLAAIPFILVYAGFIFVIILANIVYAFAHPSSLLWMQSVASWFMP